MSDTTKQKKSGFRGIFGMMREMRKCMSGSEGGFDCASMMERCSTMMNPTSGAEDATPEEASAKA